MTSPSRDRSPRNGFRAMYETLLRPRPGRPPVCRQLAADPPRAGKGAGERGDKPVARIVHLLSSEGCLPRRSYRRSGSIVKG